MNQQSVEAILLNNNNNDDEIIREENNNQPNNQHFQVLLRNLQRPTTKKDFMKLLDLERKFNSWVLFTYQ